MAAEIQHITYNEFLPTLLGQKLMDSFELSLKTNDYHMAYNDELPMTTLNSVANAILPLVLSLLPPAISTYDSVSLPNQVCGSSHDKLLLLQSGKLLSQVPLNHTYWAPIDAHDPVKVQQIMLGLTKTSAEKMDLALARDTKICMYILKMRLKQ